MGARFRSWWQQIKKQSFTATGIIVALVVLIVCIFSAYHFGWSGTGFLNKSLWDWLQLLIIPLALAAIALVFQLANSRTERQIAQERYEQDQQIAKQRYEQDQQIALDKQQEVLLQAYLDRMAELLLEKQLLTSDSEEVRNVARVRTTTVLTQLDARRIGYVFAFLREAGLMSTKSDINVLNLKETDLRAVNWSQANLSGANLSRANLSEANLSRANLSEANLFGADLSGANFGGTELSEAVITEEQLKQAASLQGATMPDGSIHP